jgi:hypothetical protein
MVDTGYWAHPYYTSRNYNITFDDFLDPDSSPDPYGHGTGICSNLLAVAPDIDFTMVKNGDSYGFSGLLRARTHHPDVITCSWGHNEGDIIRELNYNSEFIYTVSAMLLEIMSMIFDGIVVIFASGNEGWRNWLGMLPAVISVGGAYVDDTLTNWEASSYASSGILKISGLLFIERKIPIFVG